MAGNGWRPIRLFRTPRWDGSPLIGSLGRITGKRPMGRTKFRSIRTKAGYAPWLADLAGANGVYVIRQRARRGQAALILYVGESHTHRLRETLQRHFQQWTGHTAGPTFDAK